MATKGIEGIVFDPNAEILVSDLLSKIHLPAGYDVYPVPKMNEIRLAHYMRGGKRKRARGVFARIRPVGIGAIIIGPHGSKGEVQRHDITANTTPEIIRLSGVWHRATKDLLRGTDKSEVERRWDTVSGGRPESDRSKF